MKRIQVVVIVIIPDNKGKYLLTKRKSTHAGDAKYHGMWQLPGGGLEFGETLEGCAVREAHEELGIDIEVVKQVPTVYIKIREAWQGVFVNFVCRRKDVTQKIVLNEEASEYDWFTLEELRSIPYLELLDKIIEEVELG